MPMLSMNIFYEAGTEPEAIRSTFSAALLTGKPEGELEVGPIFAEWKTYGES